jgi:radical SAM protein with 4Fe4S-binding SPASM domain
MMQNVGLMLKKGITVALRMNYDQDTYREFADLLQDVGKRYQKGASLFVYPHPINLDAIDDEEREAWFDTKNVELNDLACDAGFFQRKIQELPSLSFKMCGAANDRWFVIRPDGKLICCGEQLGDDQVKGDLKNGVTNLALAQTWKQFADNEQCRVCSIFPCCAKMLYCRSRTRCNHKKEFMTRFMLKVNDLIDASIVN